MRIAVALVVALSGCSCGDRTPGRDSGTDAAVDAGRDAAVDAGRDAAVDAGDADTGPGTCPDGETWVAPVPVRREGEDGECGGECRQVTHAARTIAAYDLDGAHLAYVPWEREIGVVDLETGDEFTVPLADEANERFSRLDQPIAVGGGTVVYSTFLVDGSRRGLLWRYDLGTHCRRLLGEFETLGDGYVDVPTDLDVSGSWLVWGDERWGAGRQDVFSYDLLTGAETRLTSWECCAAATRISGTRVAFLGWGDGPRGIRVIPVDGGEAERVWRDPREQDDPAIHGDRVVFTYEESIEPWDWDIHGVDLEDGKPFVVADAPDRQEYPDVHGDLVVWEDYRNDPFGKSENVDIYARDLGTGEEIQVTSLPGLETRPRVWERTAYFVARLAKGTPAQVYAVEVP